jgi:glycerol-3-phosphate cytidylyltransferase
VSTVYTGGSFDLFHAGHASLLQACKKLAGPDGRVIVALNTDGFIASYKRKAPVMAYPEREAVLLACRYVDEVTPNRMGADSRPTIEAASPDIIAIGMDWAAKDYYHQMGFDQKWLVARHITLVYVEHAFSRGLSSSELRVRIAQP